MVRNYVNVVYRVRFAVSISSPGRILDRQGDYERVGFNARNRVIDVQLLYLLLDLLSTDH